jgi:hypothetical protein
MKITIKKSDWNPRVDYLDQCGCLLWRAARRRFGQRREIRVVPGSVTVDFDYSSDGKVYRYRQIGTEHRLKKAHNDPTLLPLTIELKRIR